LLRIVSNRSRNNTVTFVFNNIITASVTQVHVSVVLYQAIFHRTVNQKLLSVENVERKVTNQKSVEFICLWIIITRMKIT